MVFRTEGGATDSDRDGLSDALERQLGTNPNAQDTDGDAILDGVEVAMLRYDLSSSHPVAVDLDLDNDGRSDANPLVKDVFVEVDHMDDYRLNGAVTAFVEKPFRLSPQGRINLHIDQDDGGNSVASVPCLGLGPPYRDQFFAVKAANFDANRKGVFHYALLANKIPNGAQCGDDSILGQAYGNDDDFLLAFQLLQFSGGSQIAAVFMHELGHNLGLVTEAYAGIDNLCTLPGSTCFDGDLYDTYESVMNYRFQRGYGATGPAWVIDYSDGSRGPDRYGHPDFNDWGTVRFDGIRDSGP